MTLEGNINCYSIFSNVMTDRYNVLLISIVIHISCERGGHATVTI